ncbi:hypothetical protein HanRHA438_Chr02g0067141 [Helianthus annuus]|nr:hypothetical protein HanRHA438_Chr02g0067141 [Helianthus annuus]
MCWFDLLTPLGSADRIILIPASVFGLSAATANFLPSFTSFTRWESLPDRTAFSISCFSAQNSSVVCPLSL